MIENLKHRRLIYCEYPASLGYNNTNKIEKQSDSKHIIFHRESQVERQQLPLGATIQGLLYDLWYGFHPDSFASLLGCVGHGGFVILIGPPLAKLHLFQDPGYENISSWPRICPTECRYLMMFQQSLLELIEQRHALVVQCHARADWDRLLIRQYAAIPPTPELKPTTEQLSHLKQILAAHENRTVKHGFLMLSNRGCGKTTTLFLLLKQWACSNNPGPAFYVTRHHQNRLAMQSALSQLEHWPVHGHIITPEQLEQQTLDHGLVLVDEAASLGQSHMARMIQRLPNTATLVLSSSVDGYEGSGKSLLHQKWPRTMTTLSLTTPLRWARNDPLALWAKRFFHINTITPTSNPATANKQLIPETFDIEVVTSAKLSTDLLAQWMSLMSLAHYRTRPSDARTMIDGPNQQLLMIKDGPKVIGGVWLSLEGPIPDDVHQAILEGKRRLKGHLAPQFTAKYGWKQALTLEWLRVVRIAVLPAYQRLGLGSYLIRACCRDYTRQVIAVSFQPRHHIASFWSALGFHEFRPGFYFKTPSDE